MEFIADRRAGISGASEIGPKGMIRASRWRFLAVLLLGIVELFKILAWFESPRDQFTPYPSFASIAFISAWGNARKVWVRTLPRAPMLAWNAAMAASSGASNRTTSS